MPPAAEQLAAVQTAFGLSKTQLAQVWKVQRQTIYDWCAGNFEAEGNNCVGYLTPPEQSCRNPVLVVKATEYREGRHDCSIMVRVDLRSHRCGLAEGLLRSGRVEMIPVFGEDGSKVRFAENDHVAWVIC